MRGVGGGQLLSELPPFPPAFHPSGPRCAGSSVNALTLIDPDIRVDLFGVPAVRTLTGKKEKSIFSKMTHCSSPHQSLLMTGFNFSSSKPVAH